MITNSVQNLNVSLVGKMVIGKVWVSPDGKITKEVVVEGKRGQKPYENSSCQIKISDCNVDVEKYTSDEVIIGENDSTFGDLLDKTLMMMLEGEKAKVTFNFQEKISFILELVQFNSKGYIFEWTAQQKYELALHHKSKGNELFKTSYVNASRRFGKALKILCSIPIAVQDPPEVVDDVKVQDLTLLKAVLYNNLASCYLKNGSYESVIDLCEKVLNVDANNVKALYKKGMAHIEENDFEKAHNCFQKVLQLEPENKAAAEKLCFVKAKVKESNAKVNAMIKKMFEA